MPGAYLLILEQSPGIFPDDLSMGSKVVTGWIFVGLSDVLEVVVFVLGVVLSAPPCLAQAELLLLELHVPSEQYWPAFAAGAKEIPAKI